MLGKQETIKTALVTGATGYIGSHLVRALVGYGWHVHVIVRPSSQMAALQNVVDQIKLHVHDGSTSGMVKILERSRPSVVFHIAAMVSGEHRADEVDDLLTANVLFSTQLIEGMFRSGVKNIVNTETFWQFRNGSEEYSPVCLYAATKQAFNAILKYYVESGYLNALSLMLYDTYGGDDTRKKLFFLLKQSIRQKRQIDLTPGEQIVDIVHIDDVIDAYLRAGEILLSSTRGRLDTYAVSSGHRMSLRQLVELIGHESGNKINVNWGGKPYRTNEVMKPAVRTWLPNWKPKVSLVDGLRQVFQGDQL